MDASMCEKLKTKYLLTVLLILSVFLSFGVSPYVYAAPSEADINDMLPITEYEKAVLDGLDPEADLASGAVVVEYEDKKVTVSLKSAQDRIVFYIDTDYFLAEPSTLIEADLLINNQSGRDYRVKDYYYAADFADFPRVFNGAAAADLAKANASDLEKYNYLKGLTDSQWWSLNKDYYFSSAAKFSDLDTLDKVVNDVSLYGSYDSIDETSDDMIALAIYYYTQMIRVSFDQANYPLSADLDASEMSDISLYSYAYKSDANRSRVLDDFFSDTIGPAGLALQMAYAFDGPRIGNGYQGVNLQDAFIFVLEAVEDEPEPTTQPTETSKPAETTPTDSGPSEPVTTEPGETEPVYSTVTLTTSPAPPPPTGETISPLPFVLFAAAAAVFLFLYGRKVRRGVEK